MSCGLEVYNPDPDLAVEIEESGAALMAAFNERRATARDLSWLGSTSITYPQLGRLYQALETLDEPPFAQRTERVGDRDTGYGDIYVVASEECERGAQAVRRLLADGALDPGDGYWRDLVAFLELAANRAGGFRSDSSLR